MRKTLACLALAAIAVLWSCSDSKNSAAPAPSAAQTGTRATTASKHKYAKAIEIAGVRVSEKGVGKLQIRMGVVNHSIADLGDVGLKITLRAKGAKPEDPPLAEFPCKVALGPEEWKEVTVDIPTKLRVYELPDWQFIDTTYQITSPAV
jgi:hypothetical protein